MESGFAWAAKRIHVRAMPARVARVAFRTVLRPVVNLVLLRNLTNGDVAIDGNVWKAGFFEDVSHKGGGLWMGI